MSAHAMHFLEQLSAMGAPHEIEQAAQRCNSAMQAQARPSQDDIAAIQKWYNKQAGQDRYGK